MTNNEKLEAVKAFLKENCLAFYPHFRGKLGVKPDLYVPQHKIMVKLSEGKEKDDEFFHTVKHKYHPLFIRNNETEDFVLEKMRNLIIDLMKRKQAMHLKSLKKNASKL